MARKKLTCFVSRCDEPPYLGGRCKEHYDEDKRKQQERRDAVEVLNNSGVDGTYPTDKSLRQLLSDIQKWWSRAHSAMAYGRTDSVLRDEAEYAAEWCVALAWQIVRAERAFRAGQEPDYMLQHTSAWVFERFNNLQKGLMSNGVPRPVAGS